MRVLLLMRGSAGCGKSTFIEKHGLKPYTLCVDDIRLMCQSSILNIDGTKAISQSNDKVVWNTLFKILETRMENGEFTVIDATNSKTTEMTRYRELAETYRYRIYCIDMTDIPIEEVKRRNAAREEMKRVPEEVIDKFYSRFETQKIPSGIKVLKPNELDSIWYKPFDASEYNKIHVFGDIHGCYTALKEYLDNNGGIKPDELYIFSGDYIDRGIENAEVVKWIIEKSKYKNMIFLEGNHEKWLWLYANDIVGKSKEFEFITKPQLFNAQIPKASIRNFYRRLCQCAYFTYGDKTILVTHGGISNIPNNLLKIGTVQMIKGVGKYNDADEVDRAFDKNTNSNVYSIHGHRNITNTPIQSTNTTFNLEGNIEFGGHLRVVQLDKDGFKTFEVKNDVFKEKSTEETEIIQNKDMTVYSMVEELRNNKYIYERKFDNISSFNFNKMAFEKQIWDSFTNRARGLFIDTDEYKVAARAYDKFFNINERPETKIGNLKYKLHFPVSIYVKENGFLGIVSYDKRNDDLLICSKSTINGEYSGYLADLLLKTYGDEKLKKIFEYVKENEVSFVFECCDMEHDPHIIEYDESTVVLLDVVDNKLEYNKLPYDELVSLANNIGLVVKEKACEINSWEEFFEWYNTVTSEDYKYDGNHIEGFVIEDSIGYMTKLKLHYYKFWKRLRGVAQSVIKYGNYRYTGSLLTPLENEFFGWCKSKFSNLSVEEKSELSHKLYGNICTLRKEFFEWKSQKEGV